MSTTKKSSLEMLNYFFLYSEMYIAGLIQLEGMIDNH